MMPSAPRNTRRLRLRPGWPALLALGGAALAATLTSLASCSSRSDAQERRDATADPLVKITTAEVQSRPVPIYLPLTGTLRAERESDVAADTMGKVTATFVERGDTVAINAPLARLDSRNAALGAQEAATMAQISRVQREQAAADCARAARLLEQGAINQAEHDRMTSACTTAQLSSSAAETRVRMAGKALGDATIRAPFAGMVVERYVTAGEYVMPGARVATVAAIGTLRLELTVPESAVARIKLGQEVSFEVAAFPGQRFPAKVRFISPTLRPATRDLIVEATVDNTAGALKPGMFASARIKLGETALPVIPVSAIKRDGRTARAFVAVNGRLEERVLQLGEATADGQSLGVSKGLSAGEQVAAPLTEQARDGLRIE